MPTAKVPVILDEAGNPIAAEGVVLIAADGSVLGSLPVAFSRLDPETWTTPGTSWDARAYSDVEVQVVGTPTAAYQPQRSLDGATWVNAAALDDTGNNYSTIAAAGIYSLTGNAYLRLTGGGTGATVTRRAAA